MGREAHASPTVTQANKSAFKRVFINPRINPCQPARWTPHTNTSTAHQPIASPSSYSRHKSQHWWLIASVGNFLVIRQIPAVFCS